MVIEGSDVFEMAAALWTHRGPAPTMTQPHRHDDLELNFVFAGRLQYRWAGTRVVVEAGSVALFWGATPHRLADIPRLPDDDMGWIQIPLTTVLRWGLPDDDVTALLASRPIIVPAEAVGQDVSMLIDRWCADVAGDDESRGTAMLEAQAVVRRLLRAARVGGGADAGGERDRHEHPVEEAARHTATMARFLASRFREPITASDVVEAVHLNPRYAMTLFRRTSGMTLGAYLTRCRVAEAQRLLITTPMTTSEIAHAAGFGSQSSLYAHFGREAGMSPGAYRRSHAF